jgi:hypothetical protein
MIQHKSDVAAAVAVIGDWREVDLLQDMFCRQGEVRDLLDGLSCTLLVTVHTT